MTKPSLLMLPGLGGSGLDHWQHHWAQSYSNSATISVSDWNAPDLDEWLDAVDEAASRTQGGLVLVAHSLGCALAAQWVARSPQALRRLEGVMMVAPADVDDPAYTPDCTRGFGPMPMIDLGCKVVTVTSSDDPYVSVERASAFNEAWNGLRVDVGDKGHINGRSGLGEWADGKVILAELLQQPKKGTR